MAKQCPPTPGAVNVSDIVRALWPRMFEERCAEGLATYSHPLETWNGRDPFRDAQEELIDAFQYVTQARLQFDDLRTKAQAWETVWQWCIAHDIQVNGANPCDLALKVLDFLLDFYLAATGSADLTEAETEAKLLALVESQRYFLQ